MSESAEDSREKLDFCLAAGRILVALQETTVTGNLLTSSPRVPGIRELAHVETHVIDVLLTRT
ncbi:hypothetical protein [Amycolatopsis sp. GA6-003]|uniref:hypothetical protein n=1 Tax=Amycolatopsis sp. GA6-003 TaxID=2652444 RepID=UPI0039175AB5